MRDRRIVDRQEIGGYLLGKACDFTLICIGDRLEIGGWEISRYRIENVGERV